MTRYCSTCGDLIHPSGQERSGPRGHAPTEGRLAPGGLVAKPDAEVEVEVVVDMREEATVKRLDHLPEGMPRTASTLVRALAGRARIMEGSGAFGRSHVRWVGVAGSIRGTVFYAYWRKAKSSWTIDGCYRDMRKMTWTNFWKEVKDAVEHE